ncbi:hypothetical protein J4474_04925 [Candidatus Pacearchaeota archaeon]|nr:hypothetical protein [Candidatus Pacearchaeota archaeon]
MKKLLSKFLGLEEISAMGRHLFYNLQPEMDSSELAGYFSRQTKYIVVPGFFERKNVLKTRNIPEGSAIFDYNSKQDNRKSAEQLARFIEDNYWGSPLQAIGYSMGGLVLRYAVQLLGADKYVKSFVTIATPHQGTLSPIILPFSLTTTSCWQMLPGSDFLKELNSAPLGKIEKVLCLRADSLDELVFPLKNAKWPSTNRKIKNQKVPEVNGHANILSNEKSWGIALDFLNERESQPGTSGEFGYF